MTASKGTRKAKLWRASPDLLEYATEQANNEGTNLNEWLCLLVEAVRDGTVVMPTNQASLFVAEREAALRTAS